jgi:hypothetical protein
MSVGFGEFDEEKERARPQKMSDEDLIREGKTARFLCSPNQNFSQAPPDVLGIALRLCIEEWRRRHPEPNVIAESNRLRNLRLVPRVGFEPAACWLTGELSPAQ